MFFKEYIEHVQRENPTWKSNSRIIGRACELYCCNNIKCLNCNSLNWLECVTNEKSKDQICKTCNKQYQIKCKNITPKQYNKIKSTIKFKTIGAEYNTTLKSLDNNIDYLIILYDKTYFVLDILHVRDTDITSENVIPRKKLSENARRAGWQGCYLYFNKFKYVLNQEYDDTSNKVLQRDTVYAIL